MKRILITFNLILIIFLGSTYASGGGGGSGGTTIITYQNTISTNSGGVINIEAGNSKTISFSNELSSIDFSKSSDISVRTLEGGVWKDVGNQVSNFRPLQGFIITNHAGDNLSITYKYKANIDSLSSLIQRRLPAGWNLIGISQNGAENQFDSISNGLGHDFNYSQIVDFTHTNFSNSNNSRLLSNNFNIKNKNEYGNLFENKAYAVFNNTSSILGGTQNLTDGNGNLIYRTLINGGEDITNNNKYKINGLRVSNTFILGHQNARVYQTILQTPIGSELERLRFVVTGYDGVDENNTVDFTISDFEDLRLTYNGNIIAYNPNITQSGSNIFIATFDDINYTFDDINLDCIENAGYNQNNNSGLVNFGTNYVNKCFVLEKNIQPFLPEDNLRIRLDRNYTKITYDGIELNKENSDEDDILGDLLDQLLGGSTQGDIILRKTTNLFLNNHYSYNSKLALSEEKDVVFSDLRFISEYGDTKITELYFANDSNGDNGINADISNEIIENIRIKINDTIHNGNVVLSNGRLAIKGLDIVIPKSINSGNNTAIQLIGDIALIDSDAKTNKKIKFRLTDLKAESVDNGNILTKVGDMDVNKQFSYTLHEGLNIPGSTKTTRKSTFTINTLPLNDTVLDNGEKTIWKGNIKAIGGDISLAKLDFRFNGFLNNISLNNLIISGNDNNIGSYLKDSNGNKILSNFDLYINGEKVEYRNEFKNNYFSIYKEGFSALFNPITILSGNKANIELKATFSNVISNDYFYVDNGFYYLYSDKSAGINHSETSNDWFNENKHSNIITINGNTSGTLIADENGKSIINIIDSNNVNSKEFLPGMKEFEVLSFKLNTNNTILLNEIIPEINFYGMNIDSLSNISLYKGNELITTKSNFNFTNLNLSIPAGENEFKILVDFNSNIDDLASFDILLQNESLLINNESNEYIVIGGTDVNNILSLGLPEAKIVINSSTPYSKIIVPSSSEQSVFTFDIQAKKDDIKVTDIYIKEKNGNIDLTNLKSISLIYGGKVIEGVVLTSNLLYFQIGDTNPIIINKDEYKTFDIKLSFNDSNEKTNIEFGFEFIQNIDSNIFNEGTYNGLRIIGINSGVNIENIDTENVKSKNFLYARSKPVISLYSNSSSTTLLNFSITADSNRKINIKTIGIEINGNVNLSGSTINIYKDSVSQNNLAFNSKLIENSNPTNYIEIDSISNFIEISAGSSKNFIVEIEGNFNQDNKDKIRESRIINLIYQDDVTNPEYISASNYLNTGLPSSSSVYKY